MKIPRFLSRGQCAGLLLALAGGLALPVGLGGQTVPAAGNGELTTVETSGAGVPAELQVQLQKLLGALKAAHTARDAKAAAIAQSEIGNLYFRAGSYGKAREFYNLALSQARSMKIAAEEAAALNGIGNCYRIENDNQKALDIYHQALDLATASGDLRDQAAALIGIGWVSDNAGDAQNALDFENRALTMAQSAGDSSLEALALRRIGIDYAHLGQMQQALDHFAQALAIGRRSGDRDDEGLSLNDTGLIYANLGQNEKALGDYNQALPILREAGDLVAESAALDEIGLVHASLGERQKALDLYSQALAICRRTDDRSCAADTLGAMGSVYSALGDEQKALESLNQALPIYRETGDHSSEANTLFSIGLAHSAQGDYQNALDFYLQALPVFHKAGNRENEASILGAISLAYNAQGDKHRALDFALQALTIFRQLSDLKGQSTALFTIGGLYADLGEKQKAIEMMNQALPIYRETGDFENEAIVLYNIGDTCQELGDHTKALDFFDQALPVFRKAGDHKREALTLQRIGGVSADLGDNSKALDYYNQALLIFRQLGDHEHEANALSDIGLAYNQLREEQQALEYDTQALEVFRGLGNRTGEGTTLNNIGNVYFDLGEWESAVDYNSQALMIFRETGNLKGEASALNNIGIAYEDLGEDQKALDHFNEALPILRQLGDSGSVAVKLNNIGIVYATMGDNAKALDYFNQALPVLKQMGDRISEGETLANIGIVYARLGNNEKAVDYYNRALPLASASNDLLLEANITHNLMYAEKAEEPSLAVFFGKEAVNYLQMMRGNMQGLDRELQTRFLASRGDYYHDLAELLIDQGRLPEAQQVLDLLKQQEYSDYVRGEKVEVGSMITLTPAEQQAQQDYQTSTAQLVSAGEEWAQLKKSGTRTPEQEARYQQLSDQLDNASKGLNDYYARLYVLFGKNSDANRQVADVKGNVSLLKQLIAKSPHTVALYTMVTGEGYKVIVITGSAMVEREYAIPEKDLNQTVAAFQQALRQPSQSPESLAQQLYKILVSPVKADLDQAQAQTLVWSLDGVLRYVPIAALYDGKQYLVENYSTVTITPVSIPNLSEKPDVSNLSTVAMGISQKYEGGLPPLPSVVSELHDIVNDAQVQGAHGVLPGTILLDGQFTEKAMEEKLDSPHGVVHIASHFVFKPGDDSQSYLLLAGKDQPGAGFHLTVADFRDNQKLALDDTELLTLSACETGMGGDASNGREVDGLGTTAQLKGAKAVISSLWEVNDASTGTLMADFYKRWADGAGKVPKVEALRQAQLDLLHAKITPSSGTSGRGFKTVQAEPGEKSDSGSYAHPYYWAPFVLMGNWK